jgi:hypothetical protein
MIEPNLQNFGCFRLQLFKRTLLRATCHAQCLCNIVLASFASTADLVRQQ